MTSINLQPLYDKVLIERLEAEQKTKGGIIIPDNAKEKPQKGKVLAVGAGSRSDDGKITPLTVKPNDVVLFAKWGGTEIKIEGKEYIILSEKDILAIQK